MKCVAKETDTYKPFKFNIVQCSLSKDSEKEEFKLEVTKRWELVKVQAKQEGTND